MVIRLISKGRNSGSFTRGKDEKAR